MYRFVSLLAIFVLVGASNITAQPPGGRGGGPPGGGPPGQRGQEGRGQQGPGGQHGGPNNAVLAAIDADGDHVISAREIMNAAAALKKLDRNKDGKLTSDEVHSTDGQGQRGGRPGGEAGGRNRQGGPPDAGPGGGGPPTAAQFMQHAMTFDADKDGKLSQAELKKMAAAVVEEMSRRGGPPGGGPPGGGGQTGGGNRNNRQRPDIDD